MICIYIYIYMCVYLHMCFHPFDIDLDWILANPKKTHKFPIFPTFSPCFSHVFPIFRAHRGTSEAACREFFDALEALDLVEAPTAAGQRYFGRFARWALREFLGEAKGTLELAKNVPGAVELW